MKVAFFLLALVGFAFATPVIDYDFIDEINSKATSWVAGPHEIWADWTVEQLKGLMGVKNVERPKDYPVREPYPEEVVQTLPTNFDSRQQWPMCQTIKTIYNQARCGSCWAFGCVEAVQDRFCIHSNPQKNVSLSFMDLVTCDNTNDGCEGGDPGTAWDYVKKTGLVENDCSPYTIPTCPPEQQPCLNFVSTPRCETTCASNSSLTWSSDLHYLESAYGVSSNVDQIATEIMTNGPVEGAFTVYADFVHYKSGIYEHKSGAALGGHAIKIIGWGYNATANMDYWIVSNSWTTYWGDEGYFLIRKGVNECGIESGIVAGLPKV